MKCYLSFLLLHQNFSNHLINLIIDLLLIKMIKLNYEGNIFLFLCHLFVTYLYNDLYEINAKTLFKIYFNLINISALLMILLV